MAAVSNELEQLNWHEIAEYLRADNRLVIVLGSTEQHGYLSVCTDTLNAFEIARRATRAEGVLLAPPLHYGHAGILSAWPGTLLVTADTYSRVVLDLARSAFESGFRRLCFFNGHGPNNFVVGYLQELVASSDGLVCDFFDWSEEPQIQRMANQIREGGIAHANWGENWPGARLPGRTMPSEVPWWKPDGNVLLNRPEDIRRGVPSGCFGGETQVSDGELEPLIALAAELGRARLQALKNRPAGASDAHFDF